MNTANDRRKTGKAKINQCDGKATAGRLGVSKISSATDGNDENQVLGSDSTWGSTCREDSNNRCTSSGGILGQLRDLRDSHLASLNAFQSKLEALEQQIVNLIQSQSSK